MNQSDNIEKNKKPHIFELGNEKDKLSFTKLLQDNKSIKVVDNYEEQLKELFSIQNPAIFFSNSFIKHYKIYKEKLKNKKGLQEYGSWVYFPWHSTVVHILSELEFLCVRTARNRNLISHDEQKKFYASKICVAGLSVGNSIATTIALQGGCKSMVLADFDTLELSNMNRIKTSIINLGLAKTEITAKQIYEINPYSDIEILPEGFTKGNVSSFLNRVNFIIDEIDDLPSKYLLRSEAKKRSLPVLMGADNDRSAVVDIERYDLDENTRFFNGRLGDVTHDELVGLDKRAVGKKIAELIGLENHTPLMLESLSEIGKSLSSWPQLGGAAAVNGAVIANCIQKISADRNNYKSGRIITTYDH